MDFFRFREHLTRDYAEYVRSFVRVGTPDVHAKVDEAYADQLLWPDPIVQPNPAYEPGAYVSQLVEREVLHPMAGRVFQRGKDRTPTELGQDMRLYRHQVTAIEVAQSGRPYVVMTGTGPDKSLTFIVSIVDHILRAGAGQGFRAIFVYPMNTLANSQRGDLQNLLGFGFGGTPPVRVQRYTGVERRRTLELRRRPVLRSGVSLCMMPVGGSWHGEAVAGGRRDVGDVGSKRFRRA